MEGHRQVYIVLNLRSDEGQRKSIKAWLQLFRAQTAPATVFLLLMPYLVGASFFEAKTLVLAFLLLLIHYFSFGHNSLMDAAMMYDQRDLSKRHHPLVSGKIKLQAAHNVIHWGLAVLTVFAAAVTVVWAVNVAVAMVCLMAWVSFGHAYNDGLSKESLFGFLSISLCFTAMGGWGWFLSHRDLNPGGIIYLAYAFLTILYQTSWSGFIKEMQLRERSNILVRMGAKLDETFWGKKLLPGKSRFYAYLVKGSGLVLAGLLCWLNFSLVRLVVLVLLGAAVIWLLYQTTRSRVYDRPKELKWMSCMEICTIYLVLPLLIDWPAALMLMAFGAIYFFACNKVLWGVSYPKV